MELRPYQREAIEGLFAWWRERRGENPLIVVPSAGGKTVIFSTIIRRLLQDYPGTRILILAHRKELIRQAAEKLLAVWPQAPVGIYAASLGMRQINTITIASRDSIAGVIKQVGVFDLVFIDESHNIAPGEETRYRKIIAALTERNPNLHVIGFTATPYRTGQGYIYGKDAKHLFQGVAYEAKLKPLIEAGFLCPLTAKQVDPAAIADTEGVKTTAGDFNHEELEKRVAEEELVRAAISEWERLAHHQDRRSTLFFCVSILHATLVSEELHRRGHDVPVVHGQTPQAERDELLAAFHRGDLAGIANVGVLTEGVDIPRVDCIAVLRPTKSLGLFMQMIGRGLRKHPDKENTLLLDFGGCLERFGPIDIAEPYAARRKDPRTKVCPACQSIVGIFKRKCPDCGHRFEPNPFKLCPKCEEENAPAAAKCVACGTPFFRHEREAYQGNVLSGEVSSTFRCFEVEEVSCQVQVSARSGRPYLMVIYRHSLFEYFYERLMLGYEGYAGEKAVRKWRAMVHPEVPVPDTPEEAVRLAGTADIFRPVRTIVVDMASKWKDVTLVDYAQEEAA